MTVVRVTTPARLHLLSRWLAMIWRASLASAPTSVRYTKPSPTSIDERDPGVPVHVWLRRKRKYLTTEEVGEVLQIAPKKVYDLKIPRVVLGPKRHRWDPAVVADWIEKRQWRPGALAFSLLDGIGPAWPWWGVRLAEKLRATRAEADRLLLEAYGRIHDDRIDALIIEILRVHQGGEQLELPLDVRWEPQPDMQLASEEDPLIDGAWAE